MNIFVLDSDPHLAAKALCDRHVVKMALESAQLLCTAAAKLGLPAPYKSTHQNHPCSRWLLEGRDNLGWLTAHTYMIFAEYEARYGRQHASLVPIKSLTFDGTFMRMRELLPAGQTPFAQAMPDQYKGPDAVRAYRAYYLGEKARFATWKEPSAPPSWWTQPSEQEVQP